MMTLEFHDPSGAIEVKRGFAPRAASLEGKRIGFVSNDQWQAFRMLPLLKKLLETDFPGSFFSNGSMTPSTCNTPAMSDVLFDTGKYSLKPGAREKLAKVAGILLAYPGLDIEVGGYTDNVGGDAMNQTLSENRARSVRDYLVEQGVATASVSAKGFGNTLPVATNANATGRQQNRRVELLVSGEAIGNPVNVTTGKLE